jgi:hypothetical protein
MGVIHAIKKVATHLHEVEARGQSAETPLIAMGEVLLIVVPVVLVVCALVFVAYYVIG